VGPHERRGLNSTCGAFHHDDAEQLLPAICVSVAAWSFERPAAQHLAEILQRAATSRRSAKLHQARPRLSKTCGTRRQVRGSGRNSGVIKEGVPNLANRRAHRKLLRFSSTHADNEEQSVSLAITSPP